MSSPGCSICNDTGWMRTTTETDSGVTRCDCYKQARIPRLGDYARIPPRYATATLENFLTLDNKSLEAAKVVAEFFVKDYPMAAPQGLLLMGRPGIGKTHLAVGIIQEL